jgi:hypothetical protein
VPAFDQTIEWLNHQLFTFFDVIKDFVAENEVPAVDPNPGWTDRSDHAR